VVARVAGSKWRASFVLGSLLLHAGLLSVGYIRSRSLPNVGPPAIEATELEVETLPDLVELAPEAEAPRTDGGEAVALAPHVAAARARSTASALTAPSIESEGEALAEGEAEGAVDGPEAPAIAPSAAGPRLSLSALGLGDRNQFLDGGSRGPAERRAEGRAEKARRVKRRLDRELAQGMLSQDTASGRGAGSPVLRALEGAVYASTAPLNGSAAFVFVIDSEGKLLSTTLGEASGDRERWSRVARQAAQALAARKLSVPKGKSVRLTVAVSSHLEMPSGADPGVAVDMFGLPLKRGGGERSTKVDILNPLNPTAPLSLMGDPADIGAKARRMVHAHVVSEELL
jgi:hypothetical protein